MSFENHESARHEEYTQEYERLLSWLPPCATPAYAIGDVGGVSLDDEYQPSPEREATFMRQLRVLENSHLRSVADNIGLILRQNLPDHIVHNNMD